MRQRYVLVIDKVGEGFKACFRNFPASLSPRQPSMKPSRGQGRRSLCTSTACSQRPAPRGLTPVLADPNYRSAVLAFVPLDLPT
jgi:hypothetical protein